MRKRYKTILLILLIMGLLFFIFSPRYMTWTYFSRCLFWGASDIKDYEKFPSRPIDRMAPVFQFSTSKDTEKFVFQLNKLDYSYKNKMQKIGNLDKFLESNETTAFIVIKDDTILYEKYFNGYTRDSINTSFSTAKSFVSALIGIAIDEGYINSINDPITKYIPELKDQDFEKITIKHLLTMSSGIKYVEGRLFWGDDAKTYYSDNLRELVINDLKIVDSPDSYFLYNNYHPLLLGMILERATNMSVSKYFQEKLWKPLGMEYPASWSIDSEGSGFEKMESGINARSIDFAKFGRLFLNNGNWEGRQIISEDWVYESTKPDLSQDRAYYDRAWFNDENRYYKYFWYSIPRENGDYDFFAAGHLSQYIYISPSKNVIIVRNGFDDGKIDSWAEFLFNLVNEM